MGEDKYETEIDASKGDSSHTKAIALIGEGKRVVDLGCSTGFVARVLKDKGCTVTGIELDEESAEKAREACERVVVGDLDELDIVEALGGEQYDVGLFGDVIEHLKDPKRALVAMRDLLAPDGFIVVSVPNVAHASVRLDLLKGQFEYEDVGILDASHLRFYTRESIIDLLESCGYLVDVMDWVERKVSEEKLHEVLDPLGLSNMDEVVRAFSEWDAVAFQFVIKAVPATEEGLLKRLSEDKVRAERRLRVLESEVTLYKEFVDNSKYVAANIAEMEAELAKSADYQKRLASEISAKEAYITQLENAVAESRARLEQCEAKLGEMASMLSELEARGAAGRKRKKP